MKYKSNFRQQMSTEFVKLPIMDFYLPWKQVFLDMEQNLLQIEKLTVKTELYDRSWYKTISSSFFCNIALRQKNLNARRENMNLKIV